jgi:hypothetical protein
VLAEYIVALDLGVADHLRDEWSAHHLTLPSGVKVEVKSSAYVRSWHQARLSAVEFSIGASRYWDAATNVQATESRRQADVYVFAVLHHMDQRTVDPLDLDQWTSYVLPTEALNRVLPNQKRIRLGVLQRKFPPPLLRELRFGEIHPAIQALTANR